MNILRVITAFILIVALPVGQTSFSISPAVAAETSSTAPAIAVAPQYDTTHVYVASNDFDRFVASVIATFGGTTSEKGLFCVTPTPSETNSQLILTPVGTFSVFGFTTPIPYPFGVERTGYLVSDMDSAIAAARAANADVLVSPFNDPIGKDAIIQFPGGVNTQLYWHTTAPSYASLSTIPENRVYVSPDAAQHFVHSFLAFSKGRVISDVSRAPGVEIGRPTDNYRRIRVESRFGRLTVVVTDGHLPFPYGREMTGYEVNDLSETLSKAKAGDVALLVAPYETNDRRVAMLQFPGGYIAEVHSALPRAQTH
jgi:hypothetical protein